MQDPRGLFRAALFLESYIFDYCARRESGTFARKYVDRLDPVAKWIIIPRLIVPPGLDPGTSLRTTAQVPVPAP